MIYSDLFVWWAASISFSILFLIAVGILLYMQSMKRQQKNNHVVTSISKTIQHFVFIWTLLGLLILYIVSVDVGSSILFAAGNVVVEILLLVYLLKNKSEGTAQGSM